MSTLVTVDKLVLAIQMMPGMLVLEASSTNAPSSSRPTPSLGLLSGSKGLPVPTPELSVTQSSQSPELLLPMPAPKPLLLPLDVLW